MAKVWAVGLAIALLAFDLAGVASAGNGTPINSGSADPLTLAVYGDAPYGTTPTDTAEFEATPAFIDSVNADPSVRLVIHVGDIHSGKQTCSEAYDRSIFDLWTGYKDPLVYTPGDNEWTDCQKKSEGGGDPLANLALIRSIFFPTPGVTLGGRKKQVVSQDGYPENVMWEQSKTLFVTLNIPGGSNDDADPWFGKPITDAQLQERANRSAADLAWLDAAFDQAETHGAGAVVIVTQADMWDLDGKTPDHVANYEPYIQSIASHTLDFGKPVLLFNGDSHVYRSDNPLVENAPCVAEPSSGAPAVACTDDDWENHPYYDVPNFHRVVVHGSTFPLEYLRLTINPRADNPATATSFGPFSWERVQP
jgi:hypothetical protein